MSSCHRFLETSLRVIPVNSNSCFATWFMAFQEFPWDPSAKAARGLKKHLKRLNAPKHWMLDKLGGAFAPKPSSGPHKSREFLPLVLILRNRLKYALTYREVQSILMQRHVMVDNKVGLIRPSQLDLWVRYHFSLLGFRLETLDYGNL
ncbi:40S ribosomal protein S4 [Linum perenne]